MKNTEQYGIMAVPKISTARKIRFGPKGARMKKMYWIGNAHLDPVWLWRWQDGYSEVLATYRSALDRMKETEDFKFTSACAV